MIDATDAASAWARRVAALRTQAARRQRGAASSEDAEAALSMCDTLIRELAGAQLERDRLRAGLRLADAAWDELFDVVPAALLLTDRAGVILKANRAASVLLNVSARHLKGRELLVFVQDREGFCALREQFDGDGHTALHARLMLRPRERKPAMVLLQVMAAPGRDQVCLWTITPAVAADPTASLDAVTTLSE